MKKIFIVENNETLAKILVDQFSHSFNTKIINNPADLLLRVREEFPDVLLIDTDNIEDDEFDLINKIKSDKSGEKLTIVIMANNVSSEKIINIVKSGVSDYFIKSDLTIREVYDKIFEKCII